MSTFKTKTQTRVSQGIFADGSLITQWTAAEREILNFPRAAPPQASLLYLRVYENRGGVSVSQRTYNTRRRDNAIKAPLRSVSRIRWLYTSLMRCLNQPPRVFCLYIRVCPLMSYDGIKFADVYGESGA